MHRFARLAAVIAAGSVALWTTAASAADVITDGQFYNSSGASIATYGTGHTFGDTGAPNAWRVSSGNVDVIGNSYWAAPTSAMNSFGQPAGSVDLDGTTPGAITQTITGTATSVYELSFALSSNGGKAKSVNVSINGDPATTFSFAGYTGSMTYVTETLKFTGTPTSISFASADTYGFQGPVIGNISLTSVAAAVPEPATWTMLLLGFFGLGAMLRSRRRLATSTAA